MNTPEQILACFRGHAARGMEKYTDFVLPADAVGALTHYLDVARNAATMPGDPPQQAIFNKAFARLGGILLKAYANLNIELVPVETREKEAAADVNPTTP